MKPEKNDIITISVPSETTTMKKVVMCLANPISIKSLQFGGIDAAFLYQLRYNKFAFYNYKLVREQQKAFIQVMETVPVFN